MPGNGHGGGHGGIQVSNGGVTGGGAIVTCYKKGVRIRAAEGDVPVETIKAGNHVVVIRDSREVLEPVQWVGFVAIDPSRYAHIEDAAPIRIRAGAIADGQPARDLSVSPEHCMIIDGRCVPAKLLVNGGSIVSERDHAPLTYYHIELERHGILLAENTPAESYLDTGNRSIFDNADGPRHLFPSFKVCADTSRWQTEACAPLASANEVEAIWTSLASRSVAIGFPLSTVSMVPDADVHLLVDGVAVRPASDRESRYVFIVRAGATSVSLKSRFGIPSDEMVPGRRDNRRLGLCVKWIAIRWGNAETILAADHPALQDGWHQPEGFGKSIWRWTDGSATIPWVNVAGAAMLTVCCTPMDRYPLYDDKVRIIA
jgi:voltage-gated potassium channel Kch